MKVNFEIDQGIAFEINGKYFDLHNNFKFSGFEYLMDNFNFIMRWYKSSGSWVEPHEAPNLTIIHKNVSYLNVIPRDPEMSIIEDDCLDDVTYLHSSYRDNHFLSGDDRIPNDGDDIIYAFIGGQIIRINCKEIELLIE